jgi:glyoxylase-like metal-dependent hydrolase (beta-lactamase superfamily II)
MKFTPLLAALAVAAPAFAAAPLAGTNAPGFHRIMLGDFEVTASATARRPADRQTAARTGCRYHQSAGAQLPENADRTSVNAFLINTGSKLILVDTGAGSLFGPTLGKLVANLKASGYQPEQVDEIYLTHLHPDHVGGLAASSQPCSQRRGARRSARYRFLAQPGQYG